MEYSYVGSIRARFWFEFLSPLILCGRRTGNGRYLSLTNILNSGPRCCRLLYKYKGHKRRILLWYSPSWTFSLTVKTALWKANKISWIINHGESSGSCRTSGCLYGTISDHYTIWYVTRRRVIAILSRQVQWSNDGNLLITAKNIQKCDRNYPVLVLRRVPNPDGFVLRRCLRCCAPTLSWCGSWWPWLFSCIMIPKGKIETFFVTLSTVQHCINAVTAWIQSLQASISHVAW